MGSAIRYRLLVPVVVTCIHLLLTAIAEVQYRTGWAYLTPGVALDPSPLAIAEHLAIWLSLPAYVITLALTIAVRSPLEGTRLLLVETPLVVLFWHLIGRWIDLRRSRAIIAPLRF